MPCGDGGNCRVIYDNSRAELLRRKLNKVTRAACDMRTILRRNKLEDKLTEDTRKWIAKHDKWDAKRIQQEKENGIREATRKRAQAKYDKAIATLNVDERRVLGL